MVLNQFCQLSMELIKNYYELSIFENKKNLNDIGRNEPQFLLFFLKKKRWRVVVGGWKNSKPQAHQSHQ